MSVKRRLYLMIFLMLLVGCASSPTTNNQIVSNHYSFALFGPLKDRKITEKYIPRYPRWAEEEGLEADIALEFEVSPSGRVIKVKTTGTQGPLESLAAKALWSFVFAPLPADEPQVIQKGVLEFYFRLAGKGR